MNLQHRFILGLVFGVAASQVQMPESLRWSLSLSVAQAGVPLDPKLMSELISRLNSLGTSRTGFTSAKVQKLIFDEQLEGLTAEIFNRIGIAGFETTVNRALGRAAGTQVEKQDLITFLDKLEDLDAITEVRNFRRSFIEQFAKAQQGVLDARPPVVAEPIPPVGPGGPFPPPVFPPPGLGVNHPNGGIYGGSQNLGLDFGRGPFDPFNPGVGTTARTIEQIKDQVIINAVKEMEQFAAVLIPGKNAGTLQRLLILREEKALEAMTLDVRGELAMLDLEIAQLKARLLAAEPLAAGSRGVVADVSFSNHPEFSERWFPHARRFFTMSFLSLKYLCKQLSTLGKADYTLSELRQIQSELSRTVGDSAFKRALILSYFEIPGINQTLGRLHVANADANALYEGNKLGELEWLRERHGKMIVDPKKGIDAAAANNTGTGLFGGGGFWNTPATVTIGIEKNPIIIQVEDMVLNALVKVRSLGGQGVPGLHGSLVGEGSVTILRNEVKLIQDQLNEIAELIKDLPAGLPISPSHSAFDKIARLARTLEGTAADDQFISGLLSSPGSFNHWSQVVTRSSRIRLQELEYEFAENYQIVEWFYDATHGGSSTRQMVHVATPFDISQSQIRTWQTLYQEALARPRATRHFYKREMAEYWKFWRGGTVVRINEINNILEELGGSAARVENTRVGKLLDESLAIGAAKITKILIAGGVPVSAAIAMGPNIIKWGMG